MREEIKTLQKDKEIENRPVGLAATVIMFLSQYIHGVSFGKSEKGVDLDIWNSFDAWNRFASQFKPSAPETGDHKNVIEKLMTEVDKPDYLDLPWVLQDFTDVYTNIIRPSNDPGKIFFFTTQNPLKPTRERAEFLVKACNQYHALHSLLKSKEARIIELEEKIEAYKLMLITP